jgi:CRISPR/Cas system-associated exonuclease Cas4 (RecB family)
MPTPRKQVPVITAWSYSRFTDYIKCPALAKFKTIDKLREPDSPSGLKGTRVHSLAAVWATKKLPPKDKDNAVFYPELVALVKAKKIPVELECFKEEFQALRQLNNLEVEQQWAFDQNWNTTSWFDPSCWLRVKVDLHYLETVKKGMLRNTTVVVVDHKSGKEYEDHKQQRSLYALAALLMYPDAKKITASHWYLDAGVERKDVWLASALPQLKKEWLQKTTALLHDHTFAPNPTDKCRFCHFRKDNKGPCKF